MTLEQQSLEDQKRSNETLITLYQNSVATLEATVSHSRSLIESLQGQIQGKDSEILNLQKELTSAQIGLGVLSMEVH